MLEKTKDDFFDRLALLTEQVLTQRCRVRRIKKEKQKTKNPLLDWLEAFIWAAGVVLLINQYLFQAYQIPSGSMIDTLLIGDRIFVNKVIFGPELLPGMAKLPSPIKPKRNDVIIFENPSYISRGPAFDIAQRIIYMLTLSLVDIDRDESGEPKAHFLIKRAVGWGGDRFVLEQGEFRIRFAGEHRWIREREFNAQRKLNHRLSRLMDAGDYPALEAAGKAMAYMDVGLNAPPNLVRTAAATLRYPDYLAREQARLEVLRGAYPQDTRYRMLFARYTQGWYVPEGRILPLGDNRDNSRDGRYFGPIREAKVLGKGSIIYWPLGRLGPIR
ncbi:MAG: signal peptidase I [Treponema sp.]|jgi:signal peptidase I|nr:signal peptidase I [Treponema sp.]